MVNLIKSEVVSQKRNPTQRLGDNPLCGPARLRPVINTCWSRKLYSVFAIFLCRAKARPAVDYIFIRGIKGYK